MIQSNSIMRLFNYFHRNLIWIRFKEYIKSWQILKKWDLKAKTILRWDLNCTHKTRIISCQFTQWKKLFNLKQPKSLKKWKKNMRNLKRTIRLMKLLMIRNKDQTKMKVNSKIKKKRRRKKRKKIILEKSLQLSLWNIMSLEFYYI